MLSEYWSIRSENDADFVYHMEDVLKLYHEPYDENRPVIYFDESSKALRGHERDRSRYRRERSPGSFLGTNGTGKNGFTSPRNR